MADGIGKQVADNLFELGKQTAKGAATALKDVTVGTVETLATGGMVTNVNRGEANNKEVNASGQDPGLIAKQQAEAKRRQGLARVRQELEVYRQRRAQSDREVLQKKRGEVAVIQRRQEESVKVRKDREFLARLKRSYSGTREGDSKALG